MPVDMWEGSRLLDSDYLCVCVCVCVCEFEWEIESTFEERDKERV